MPPPSTNDGLITVHHQPPLVSVVVKKDLPQILVLELAADTGLNSPPELLFCILQHFDRYRFKSRFRRTPNLPSLVVVIRHVPDGSNFFEPAFTGCPH